MHNLGSILKLKRLEKNIKQEQLCKGICTPSYLSRIENNRLVANKEIYKLLFERLEIDFEYILKMSNETDERIESWYKEILENAKSNEVIDELEEISQYVSEEMSIKFQIVHCRYLLMKNQMNSVEKKLHNLLQVIEKGLNRNFFLYTNVLLIYLLKKKEYSKAVDSANELINLQGFESLGNDTELGVLYHNLSLCFMELHLYEEASLFANKALTLFKDQYHLEKAMNCHIILGICLTNMKKWKEAEQTYTLAKKLLIYLPERMHHYYLKMINNNLGNCFEYQGNYHVAIHHYLQALDYTENEEKNIITLNLIRCYYNLGELELAEHWLDIALSSVSVNTPKSYLIQYEIFSVTMRKNLTLDQVIKIQKSSISYFLSKKDWKQANRYCELFARLYESFSNYKRASSMYKLAININKRLEVSNK